MAVALAHAAHRAIIECKLWTFSLRGLERLALTQAAGPRPEGAVKFNHAKRSTPSVPTYRVHRYLQFLGTTDLSRSVRLHAHLPQDDNDMIMMSSPASHRAGDVLLVTVEVMTPLYHASTRIWCKVSLLRVGRHKVHQPQVGSFRTTPPSRWNTSC